MDCNAVLSSVIPPLLNSLYPMCLPDNCLVKTPKFLLKINAFVVEKSEKFYLQNQI